MLSVVGVVEQLPSVEEHDLSPDERKSVHNFEVLKCFVLRENFFEQSTEPRDVPLPVAEVIDEAVQRPLRRHSESLVEGAASRSDSKIAVKDEQWLAYRIDYSPGIRKCVSQAILRDTSIRI
jgi:hypothetical protein